MPDVGGIAGDRLKSFIGRIERLHEERKSLAQDIAEVFREAKGTGFDPKIMRQVIKLRAMDRDDLDEQEALLEVYKRALGMLPPEEDDDASRVHAREEAASNEDLDPAVSAGLEAAGLSLGGAAIRAIKIGKSAAAQRFIEAVARNDGDSVSLTVPGYGGVKVTNRGGKKLVDFIGATP